MPETSEYNGRTLWDAVEKSFLEHADFTNSDAKLLKNIILSADALLRVLKDDEAGMVALLDTLLLMIPKHKPMGKCTFCPQGIGQLDMIITDHQAKQLLQPLDTSSVWDKMCEGSESVQHKQAAVAKKRAKEKAAIVVRQRRRQATEAMHAANKKTARTPNAKALAKAHLKNRVMKARSTQHFEL